MKKILIYVALLTMLVSPVVTVNADESFQVNANAAIAVDMDSGKILYEQNSEEKLPIASVVKILSLYLVNQAVDEGKIKWDDEVKISDRLAKLSLEPDLSNIPLIAGKKYTVRDLYIATAVASANAATIALAETVAGSEPKFVDQMRQQVSDWGIQGTTIFTSSGLNNSDLGKYIYPGSKKDDENYLSAKDVAIITRHLLNDYPDILEITKHSAVTIGEGKEYEMMIENWNLLLPGLLLGKDGVDGLKTGTNDLAGACFAGTMIRDGQRIITVVLDAKNNEQDGTARFVETGRLMDYAFDHWQQTAIVEAGKPLTPNLDIPVVDGAPQQATIVAKETITEWLAPETKKEDVTLDIQLNNDKLTAPVEKNETVGTVRIQNTHDTLGYLEKTDVKKETTYLLTQDDVRKASILQRLWFEIKQLFN